ncbi:BRO family protein [Desulfovibrio sp. ZJ200]|uniref:BRO-N domain-containing protein n=1 Tax=Desulfovibrio sp. ZJ200 TaxID=2709792 RepID=UPI0013EBD9F7|nr:BRO family protein [Desulfovibrio sp. ZJ200]
MSQVFAFNSRQIRTFTENAEIWFAAVDVCRALGLTWSGATLKAIPKGWQRMLKFNTPSGRQGFKAISEPAVYKLAFRSNKPEADAFTNWVASEVLPAIRKTGKFEGAPRPRSSRKALPAAEQLAMPEPGKDKFEAYIEQVEAFRARTTEEISRLLKDGLGLVDVYKFGPEGIRGFSSIFHNWLHEVAVSPSPLVASYWNMERAIVYSPLHLIREMEKILPDCLHR